VAFCNAYNKKTPVIECVPEAILDHLTCTEELSDRDAHIAGLTKFTSMSLTDIAVTLHRDQSVSKFAI
jgi:hypothetical protein